MTGSGCIEGAAGESMAGGGLGSGVTREGAGGGCGGVEHARRERGGRETKREKRVSSV